MNQLQKNLHYIDHLFWLLGNMYLCFFKGDLKNAKDCLQWVKVHISYRSALVSYERPPLRVWLINLGISLFGFLITVLLLVGITFIIHFNF